MPRIKWVKYLKLSRGDDYALGACIHGDRLVVVGRAGDFSTAVFFDKETGEVVETWRGEGEVFTNCLSLGGALYVVGPHGAYLYRGTTLKKVKGVYTAIHAAGGGLYLGGYVERGMGRRKTSTWLLEERTAGLAPVRQAEVAGVGDGYPIDIAVNPATGQLWAVGWRREVASHSFHSFAVVFTVTLTEEQRIDLPEGGRLYFGELYSVCFDEWGNAYVGGSRGVAKFTKDGRLVKAYEGADGYKVVCMRDAVYAFGHSYAEGRWMHVLRIFNLDLNLLGEFVLSAGVLAHSAFGSGRVAYDGQHIYVAGYDYAQGARRWVVYAIALDETAGEVQTGDETRVWREERQRHVVKMEEADATRIY